MFAAKNPSNLAGHVRPLHPARHHTVLTEALYPMDLISRTCARATLGLCCVILGLGAALPTARAQSERTEASLRFDVMEYVVEGNTVLEAEAIERAVYPFMGPEKNIADVEAAAAALQKIYRDRGYGNVTVDVPEQRADSGAITLRVTEGRIVRTRVMGSRYFSQGYILERVDSAAEGQVPHFPTLQTQLGSVNRTADRRVAPLLRPGREPGTTEIDLVVTDALPLHGSVGLNNQAGPNTSSTRLTASLRYDNLWQRDHSLGLQWVMSPEKTSEVQVLSASYTVPMGDVGQDSLTWSFTQSDSKVAAGVADSRVLGKGRIWGVRRNITLVLKETEYHLLVVGADYKDFDETIEASNDTGFSTPIAYLPLQLSWLGGTNSASGRWQWNLGLSAGLSGLVNKQREFAEKRFLASASYSIVKLDLTREQPLPWWGSSLRARVEGQWTSQPLISNEQFAVGGADSVRGYLESAAAGDSGLRTSLEWRSRELAPLLPAHTARWVSSLTGLAFVEAAAAFIQSAQSEQTRRFGLASAGFGLRIKATPGTSLSLDLGWPLRSLSQTQRGDLRLHASGLFEF